LDPRFEVIGTKKNVLITDYKTGGTPWYLDVPQLIESVGGAYRSGASHNCRFSPERELSALSEIFPISASRPALRNKTWLWLDFQL